MMCLKSSVMDKQPNLGKGLDTQMDHEEVQQIITEASTVLQLESESILKLAARIDQGFATMVDMICKSKGRVIIAGIGKSGIIARKIVATLTSTGTRALFLHPVEAMHGDLGVVDSEDIFIALSSSGETEELNLILPSIKRIGCPIIAFTGHADSTLGKNSRIIIDVGVAREACPMGLVPTCSTTAMLAMGDALAVVLINRKHFNSDDFKRYHPSGALGQRLAGKVADIMLTDDAIPLIGEGATMAEALTEMNRISLGVVLILGPGNTLSGIISDGDIRRALAQGEPLFEMQVEEMMTRDPLQIDPQAPAYDALNLMERHEVTVLPITDAGKNIRGIVHLHDILGKGAFKFNGS